MEAFFYIEFSNCLHAFNARKFYSYVIFIFIISIKKRRNKSHNLCIKMEYLDSLNIEYSIHRFFEY